MEENLEFKRFTEKIYRKTGLDLAQYKQKQMERRIRSLMKSYNIQHLDEYFLLLERSKEHFDKFMDHLTINVSEFFRNLSQWEYLSKHILPRLANGTDNIKVWSAGCSSGEEPYSLAILIAEILPGKRHTIYATDIDPEVLRKARIGHYNVKSLVNLDQKILKKYFNNTGSSLYTVSENLKNNIHFIQNNLLLENFEKNYDLILCRNVVIYFTEETKYVLFTNFFRSLKPGGVFFTGNTEQIFKAKEIGFRSLAPFFYQKPGGEI